MERPKTPEQRARDADAAWERNRYGPDGSDRADIAARAAKDPEKWVRESEPMTEAEAAAVARLEAERVARKAGEASVHAADGEPTTDAGVGGDRESAVAAEAGSLEQVERADTRHEVTAPKIVGDYYPTIPSTVGDRYFVRDQHNPVSVFDGPPAREQVVQGRIGDCGVVATLGAVAGHRPNDLRSAIKKAGDGEYEITLHDVTPATGKDPVARPTGDTTTYRVSDELPVRTDHAQRPPAGVKADRCGWPALMEKVVAAEDQMWDATKKAAWEQEWTTRHKPTVDRDRQNDGLPPSPNDAPTGYNRLDIGTTARQRADLLARLTGQEAEVRPIPGENEGEKALLDAFRNQLDDSKPILVGTRAGKPGELLPSHLPADVFAFGHVYEVTKVENDKVHLRNPWGEQHNPSSMDAKTFWEYCRWYNHDGSRDGNYTTLK